MDLAVSEYHCSLIELLVIPRKQVIIFNIKWTFTWNRMRRKKETELFLIKSSVLKSYRK